MGTSETKVKVSVIVPVYDPGPGILSCLDSLINQTLRDIEIIFVDDCGQDGATEILTEAAKEDPRIRVIRNERNIGAGPSRNKGIEIAKGEYLSFVDADDHVECDFLELLYNKAKENDAHIAKGGHDMCMEKNGVTTYYHIDHIDDAIEKSLKEHLPLMNAFFAYHCSAIYHASLFEEGRVFYGDTAVSEDTTFLLRACAHASSLVLIKEAVYHYSFSPTSASKKMDEHMLMEYAKGFKAMMGILVEEYPSDKYAVGYAARRVAFMFFKHFSSTKYPELKESRNEFVDRIREVMEGLPFFEDLKENYPFIKIFAETGNVLPIYFATNSLLTRKEEEAGRKLVALWVDFLNQRPEYYPIAEKQLIGVIKSRTFDYEKDPSRERGKRLLLFPPVRKELRRLPLTKGLHLYAGLALETVQYFFRILADRFTRSS